ncbi:translation initiation factor IF-2 N-terminal domain-containing protein, partial [Neisseria meningitidis]|nr:translation initiation factor IF-2 N-terminal domain-containing protein [Neisseria meningitidis]
MSNTTVEQFAAELKRPVEDLLKQLKEAGVSKTGGGDSLTLDDKQLLNAYLTKKNGSNGGTISIRRTKTEVSTVDGVKVETRKRGRTVNIPSAEELAAQVKAAQTQA